MLVNVECVRLGQFKHPVNGFLKSSQIVIKYSLKLILDIGSKC